MQQLRLFFAMALLYMFRVASCWNYFTTTRNKGKGQMMQYSPSTP